MNYSLKEKTATAFWFIKQPKYWKQFISLLKRRIYNDDTKDHQEAITYCKSIEITLEDYLQRNQVQRLSFKTNESNLYKTAEIKQKNSKYLLGGGANLDLLYTLTSLPAINNILETGVAYGWSSLSILASLNNKNKGQLVSIDMPYPKMNNEESVGIVVSETLKKRWTLIREADITGIEKGLKQLNRKLDMCHYDSDKSYQGRIWAYPKLWNALKSGGYFISDDIQDNLGFKEFCESNKLTPAIIAYDDKYLGILIKP